MDVIALPTSPILPPPLDDPATVSVASVFTRPWSVFGWPAVTVPCAAGEPTGCGIQFVGRLGDDVRLLGWASRLQGVISNSLS